MIKILLLDTDGVIVNAKKFSQTLEDDYAVTTSKTLPFFQGKFLDCLVGKADLKQELTPHLKEWGLNKSVDEFLEYWFTSEHKIDEKLVEYVQQLRQKGVKCYVATNQEKHRTEYLLNKMNFSSMFDGVFSSADIGFRKPQNEFFQYMLNKLEVKPSEVLFWDDSQGHIDAAKRLGIQAEIYTTFEDFSKKMKTYTEQ